MADIRREGREREKERSNRCSESCAGSRFQTHRLWTKINVLQNIKIPSDAIVHRYSHECVNWAFVPS